MRIFFATWLVDKTLGNSLTKIGGVSRLLSYHYIREGGYSSDQIKKYCRRGRMDPTKRKEQG